MIHTLEKLLPFALTMMKEATNQPFINSCTKCMYTSIVGNNLRNSKMKLNAKKMNVFNGKYSNIARYCEIKLWIAERHIYESNQKINQEALCLVIKIKLSTHRKNCSS